MKQDILRGRFPDAGFFRNILRGVGQRAARGLQPVPRAQERLQELQPQRILLPGGVNPVPGDAGNILFGRRKRIAHIQVRQLVIHGSGQLLPGRDAGSVQEERLQIISGGVIPDFGDPEGLEHPDDLPPDGGLLVLIAEFQLPDLPAEIIPCDQVQFLQAFRYRVHPPGQRPLKLRPADFPISMVFHRACPPAP